MNTSLRILHLEDNPRDAELIHRALRVEGVNCEIVGAKSREEFEAAMAGDPFEVVLCDYSMPNYNGFSALDFARSKAPGVPFIFVSGTLGEELAIESLKTGATDYILKQHLNRLASAVRRAVREAAERGEKERAQEALERMRRRNELILQSTGEGVYGVDLDGKATFVNAAAAAMLGYAVEELIGQPVHAFLRHTRRDGSVCEEKECPIHAAYTRGVAHQSEDELFWRKDGTRFPAEYVCNPIRSEQAALGGAVITFRDITERRRVEDHLRQSQKMEAIGQLAGGIAHDFNNILGCIIGYAELARDESSSPAAVEEHLHEVLKASHRATELVRQILTFSRQQKQERKPIKLQPVVGEALKLLRASLPSTIEICADIQPDTPTVLADGTQIHQIIMNLATNAAHAMGGRGELGVKLDLADVDADFVRVHPDLRVGRYVQLSISDTGCGMDKATLQRIYEPFFTTKPPGEGTGLGLAVVHGIVKSHEGAASVYSQPGKGTQFHFYFPAHDSGATEHVHHSPSIPHGNGERVLFVDDEPPLALLGKRLLERAGYQVTVQTSATEALTAYRAEPNQYQLVVTDLTMPDLTGVELACELLKLRPELPIVLTTGFGGSLDSAKAKALGIRELLLKPISARSLAECAHRVLTKSARPSE